MKKLLVLSSIALSISSFSQNSFADDRWSCTAKDGFGTAYIGQSQSQTEAKQLAMSNCSRNSSIKNCHVDPFVLCTPPTSPVLWECKAKDAFGREYISSSQVREEAKTLALANCNRNSSAGNCHIIDALGGACEQKMSSESVKIEQTKPTQQKKPVQEYNEQEQESSADISSEDQNSSQKFVSLTKNSDGSYTIEAPRFRFDGQSYYLSPSSSPEGVCKKFGFDEFVSNSLVKVRSDHDFVQLNEEGKYAGIEFGNYVLKYLSCKNKGEPLNIKGNFAESISENDDDTVSIRKPMFKINNEKKFFHMTTSLDGICRLYGKGKAIDSKNMLISNDVTVLVDGQGHFVEVNMHWSRSADQVYSVVCEKE